MQFLTLPHTGLRISNLCLGTADLGAGVNETDSFALLDQFVAAGGNFLDTAAIYADWTPAGKGSSEKLIGKWVKSAKADVVIATKGAHPELDTLSVPRLSQAQIEFDLNDSLRNLGVESIDLYYLHRDDPSVPVAEILGVLEEFVFEGKIKYYGFSNWKLERAQDAIKVAKELNVKGFVANQPLWSLAQADLTGGDQTLVTLNEDYQAWHAETGLPVIPYSSQAGGYFNKIAAGKEIQGALKSTYDSGISGPTNRVRFEKIKALADETGLSITQIILGYLYDQPFPVIPIVGCKNAEQLADSLEAVDVKLTAEQLVSLTRES